MLDNFHRNAVVLAAVFAAVLYLAPAVAALDEAGLNDDAAPGVTELPLPIAPVEHNFPITTASPEAQDLFNKGLRFAYQMQPLDAFEAFIEATESDPDCGMCYWGAALVLGPNLDTPMDPINNAQAYELSQKALTYATMVSGIEEDLIVALSARYSGEEGAERSALDQSYSEAMRNVARKYPMNDDVLTLLAGALMNERQQIAQRPPAELPKRHEILDLLQEALALNPDNPGANQYYDEALKTAAEENVGN